MKENLLIIVLLNSIYIYSMEETGSNIENSLFSEIDVSEIDTWLARESHRQTHSVSNAESSEKNTTIIPVSKKRKNKSITINSMSCPECSKQIRGTKQTLLLDAAKSHFATAHLPVTIGDIKFNEDEKKYTLQCEICLFVLTSKTVNALRNNIKKHIMVVHAELPKSFIDAVDQANDHKKLKTEEHCLLNPKKWSAYCIACGFSVHCENENRELVKKTYAEHLLDNHNIEVHEVGLEKSIVIEH